MTKETKRPRLTPIEIYTILAALSHYESFLNKHLAKVEEDPNRFAPQNQDKWLQTRERLNWMRMTTLAAKVRLERQTRDAKLGRPEDLGFYALAELLNLKGKDSPGEYIRCLDTLKYLPSNDVDVLSPMFIIYGMVRRGLIAGYHDPNEDGLLKVRKLDVMRLAAYVEAVAPKHRNNLPC